MIRLRYLLLCPLLILFGMPTFSIADATAPPSMIHKAAYQGTLTQRIAKAYFFLHQGVRTERAEAQLKQGLAMLERQHNEIKSECKGQELQELFTFIDITLPDYATLVATPISEKTGKEVLILSETLLEVYQSVADKMGKNSSRAATKSAILSEHLAMLSQRAAKQYSAYRSGISDPDLMKRLDATTKEFATTFKNLIGSKQNTPQISSALTRVKSQWDMLSRFLNQEKDQHPVTVFAASDKITRELDEIAKMYAK